MIGVVSVGVAIARFDSDRPGEELLRIPTSSRVVGDVSVEFQRSGTIYAARHSQLVCYYLDDASGDALVFPSGYAASQDLKLRDPDGRVVADPGYSVGFAFGTVAVKVPAECGSDRPARAVIRVHGLGD